MSQSCVLGKLSPEMKIYRIFQRKYFFELFEDKQNALLSPTNWNDPFENVFLNSTVKTRTGERGSLGFRNDVYAQCWTLARTSDAMWQIYSREEDAIRVRTTVGKLIESLRSAHGEWADVCCFVGRVEYLSEKRLTRFGETVFRHGISPEAIARSLLAKRLAYKHEREVRLIFFEPRCVQHARGVYKYKIDPHTVFDQAMIDGRVSKKAYPKVKRRILERTGFPSEQIKRSMLYDAPQGFVVHIP